MNRKRNRGFSLIELLIVVAIILIIAAVAIPSLTGTKSSANQLSAVQSLRAISQSETMYSTTYNQGYSSTLAQLGPATGGQPTSNAAGLINDTALISGTKSGYIFKYAATPSGFTVNADPQTPGKTGVSHYYMDDSGTIHVNNTVPAGPNDNPLGG